MPAPGCQQPLRLSGSTAAEAYTGHRTSYRPADRNTLQTGRTAELESYSGPSLEPRTEVMTAQARHPWAEMPEHLVIAIAKAISRVG